MSRSSIVFLSQLIAVLSLFCMPFTSAYAKAGCCSGHGGVTACDATTGHQMCKDGTAASATCTCKKTAAPAATTATTATTTTTQTKSTPNKTTTKTKSTHTAATVTKSSNNESGCCSKHGGVASCNKSKGYLMCKDGSQSSSCKCS